MNTRMGLRACVVRIMVIGVPRKPKTHRQMLNDELPKGWTPKEQHDQRRGNSTQRGYGTRWQKARKAYLAKHPLCVHCEKDGRTALATDLDHIVPHRGDMKLFWDFKNNVQGLCHSCHSRKTGRGE